LAFNPNTFNYKEETTLIIIVSSSKDAASMNIRHQLLMNWGFQKPEEKIHNNMVHRLSVENKDVQLVTINEELIYFHPTWSFHPQVIIYISRHSSQSGTPTLSVHVPGNLSQATKGGLTRKVSIAPAIPMKEALHELAKQRETRGLDYEVSYECTHHGPSFDVPTMFVELGSSPLQWRDTEAATVVAHAVIASIRSSTSRHIVTLGIGGPHYSQKFTRLALEGPHAFGHIIPKYLIPKIDIEIMKQCVDRTLEPVELIILDWKGIRSVDKPTLVKNLKALDVPTQKT